MAKPNDYEEMFELNGEQIKTIVTSSATEIEKQLSYFLRPSNNNQTKVIGFDVDWFMCPSPNRGIYAASKCATLQLCDGPLCLIIQLIHFRKAEYWDPVRQSVLNFLRHPSITFVGVGIKDNLAKLEKHHGFGIRNAVELGPLAASAMKMPRLSYCGVDELAYVVNGLDLKDHRALTTAHNYIAFDPLPLPKELAKFATVNVYSYYKIGSTLLQSNVVGSLDSGLVRLW